MNGTEDKEANFIISPFSIWSALAMASGGAEAETLQQMQTVLSLPAEHSHDLVSGWSRSLGRAGGVKMKVANRLWGRKGLPFRPDFLKLSSQQYQATLGRVEFRDNPDGARKQINRWVSDQTEHKIKDLLAPGVVDTSTELVLTNAIYFNGKWVHPFTREGTEKRGFTLASGEKVEPVTMRNWLNVNYMENRRLQAVRLSYEGDDMSMIVVLPRKRDVLIRSKAFLDAPGFAGVLAALKPNPRGVVVQLPKFEAAAKLLLSVKLKDMGMTRAFSDKAQFNPLCEQPLEISEVIHQAWVKVEEKGTEAAAATAVVWYPVSASIPSKTPPKMFIADHPFLFFIIDNRNGGIVFAGRVMRPGN